MTDAPRSELMQLTAQIVAAYVGNNAVVAGELPTLIGDVHDALTRAAGRTGTIEREEAKPAVAIKKSVTPDYIQISEAAPAHPLQPLARGIP
jgi:predicted transcriptional regulator